VLRKAATLFVVLAALIIFGCGGGGSGTTGGPPPPPPNGIAGVQVAFYDINGAQIAIATTDSNGDFTANVPTDARFFHLIRDSISTSTHFRMYKFNGQWYSAADPTCKAPLPNLSNGQVLNLPGGDIRIPSVSGTIPPPPGGCGQPAIGSGSGGTAVISSHIITGS
jgi:hypothetical protein